MKFGKQEQAAWSLIFLHSEFWPQGEGEQRFGAGVGTGGIGEQDLNGSPVNPLGHVHWTRELIATLIKCARLV